MNLTTITSADLAKIAKLLQHKEALQERIAAIDQELNAFGSEEAAPAAGGMKRSAATRARMAASQRARWAKAKGEAAPSGEPKTRQMSAAGRAAIAAAARARWARARAAEGATPAAPKAKKRNMSPEGRAAIAAAAKARWARFHAGK